MSFLINPFLFSASKILVAAAGSYTVTGSTAEMVLGHHVVAGAGSYAVTGSNASLVANRKLAAGAGSYTVTGTAATLLHGQKLAAGAGSYTLTGSDVVLPFQMALTIASGTVASDLTDFVTYVDLSTMPANFWSAAKSDGGDVRVYTSNGTTQIPFDLVHFDKTNSVGKLFFKASLLTASNNVFKIECGYPSRSLLANSDTYGRNNVWSDYHRVFVFPDIDDRTGSGNIAAPIGTGATPYDFAENTRSPNIAVHQGVAWDGTYYYAVDTNEIRKYDASWNLVATKTNPIGATGISGVDHCGDPEVLNGFLYIPMEVFPNSPYNNQHIALFDTATLTYQSQYDISAQAHEAASIGYNPADGYMYVASFVSAGVLDKYDPANSMTYIGTVTVTDPQASANGVTFYNGKMFISIDAGGIRQYSLAGQYERQVYPPDATYHEEGLSHTDNGLLWTLSNTSSIGYGVDLRRSAQTGQVGWQNQAALGYSKSTGLTRFTTWTMGVSVVPQNKTSNNSVLSYTEDATADTTRATFALRSATPAYGLWNSTDSWLMDSGSNNPTLGTEYHYNVTHATTANRKIYRNGTGATDTTVVQKPSGSNPVVLYIGAEDASLGERTNGSINFVYLRNGELTANWIAAEDKSWRTPGSFYTIA